MCDFAGRSLLVFFFKSRQHLGGWTATDTGIISATSTENQHLVLRESNKTFTVCKKPPEKDAKKGRILHSFWVGVTGSEGLDGVLIWLLDCTGSSPNLKGKGGGNVWSGGGRSLGLHYLWTCRCSPLMGLSEWGRWGCSSSWARREKWSEGMWGCGQPVMLLSMSHWLSSGPSRPRTLMWVLEKKM